MKNKPQAKIARLTAFMVILTFAGAANAARFERNPFDNSTVVSFGETFDSFNGTVGLYPNQVADRNVRNVTRLSFNEAARISFKDLARCNGYEAPSVDRNVNTAIAFRSSPPANLGFNYSQFNLARSVDENFQPTTDFNFGGGTTKRLFNNATKFSSTDLDRSASQKGLSGFKSRFENPLI